MPFVTAIDLFCGAGGLTRGLENAEIRVAAGIDIDPDSRYPYERNNKAAFVLKDVKNLSSIDLNDLYGNAGVRLLAGCAPCQPFSSYSRSIDKHREHGDWRLLAEFGRLVTETKPELVTMENVPSLAAQQVFRDFVSCLSGYRVWFEVVEVEKIGVPQTRKRLVLLASRLGGVSLVPCGERSTVFDAIGHLPRIDAGSVWDEDPLHVSSKLSELNGRRIRASRPGGTWRDWEPELLAECHVRASGSTYPSVYGRMCWSKPAPTITTQCFGYGNGRFGHPDQDRAISLREAALLQTFPPDYDFVPPGEPVRFSVLGRLIGNAVPVRLGEVIGQTLQKHVDATFR